MCDNGTIKDNNANILMLPADNAYNRTHSMPLVDYAYHGIRAWYV